MTLMIIVSVLFKFSKSYNLPISFIGIELYNIIITTCVNYLHEEKYKNISLETLLKIASKDAAAFKTVTNLLNEDQKSLLEITMREAILKSSSKSPSNANNNIPSKQQPSISLKSFS